MKKKVSEWILFRIKKYSQIKIQKTEEKTEKWLKNVKTDIGMMPKCTLIVRIVKEKVNN